MQSSAVSTRSGGLRSLAQLRVWHLSVLVLFVAVAIENIQEQRIREPVLLGLACAGFVLYGILGCVGWALARKLEPRLGGLASLILYFVALGVLFLVATWIYTVISILYLGGGS